MEQAVGRQIFNDQERSEEKRSKFSKGKREGGQRKEVSRTLPIAGKGIFSGKSTAKRRGAKN